MRVLYFILIATALMLGFMNCSEPPKAEEGASDLPSTTSFSYKTFKYDETKWCPNGPVLSFDLASRKITIENAGLNSNPPTNEIEISEVEVLQLTTSLTDISLCSICKLEPDGSSTCPAIGCTSQVDLIDDQGQIRESIDCLSYICNRAKDELFHTTLRALIARTGVDSTCGIAP